jgi:subtilisin family serine protease
MKIVALVLAVAAALATAVPAHAARFAVGLSEGASPARVAAEMERDTGGRVADERASLGALTLTAPSARGVRHLPGVEYVERLDVERRLAFVPSDPLASKQWYLGRIHAFDAWAEQPPLAGPLVAIIDSGIDGEHPDLKDQIVAARTFSGGNPRDDQIGHGTFVAGIVAARQNALGIAGIAWPAGLLVAKVVDSQGQISLESEVRAIRWAADRGARVINMSLGGIRNPLNSDEDTFSPLEAAAIRYAYSRGAVIVAAVGNADQAPKRPWPWANYPAALPHVIGVSAITRQGSVPTFSHRDRIYNDLAAPGTEMVSTLPRALTEAKPACVDQGYSDCGPEEFRDAEGTSFAAPQVSGAVALLRSVRPELTPDQVMEIVTRTAEDANPATGCGMCPRNRDRFSGWGVLDVTAAVARALSGKIPARDALEPNDDAGGQAHTVPGQRTTIRATVDYWDDQSDVYRIRLFPGQKLFASLGRASGMRVLLWRPGTRTLEGLTPELANRRVGHSARQGANQLLGYSVPAGRGGFYYLQVKLESKTERAYSLTVVKSKRS